MADKRMGAVTERVYTYLIEIRETSNVFRVGHRIGLIIKGQDSLSSPDQLVRYHYHVSNMETTHHRIFRTPKYLSYLLLAVIPK